jgi:glutamate-1-semialdehyde 2,1-aminomutase
LDETLIAPFNDLCATDEIIRRHKNELAAVLVEPVMGACGMIPAEPAFLEGLREVTRKHGVVLVFDEVITFRLAPGGAQQVYGVSADLTTFGKIIGGGLPVGAFGGREDVMSLFDPRRAGGIQHSGTFNANTATMAAGIAALELLTPERILEMNRLGSQLRKGLQQILDDAQVAAHVTGAGSLAHVHLTDGLVRDYRSAARANTAGNRLLHLALLNRGVFSVSRGMFITSTALRECDVEFVLTAYADAVQELMPALSAPPGSWFTIEGQS